MMADESSTGCPVAGCKHQVHVNDLLPDHVAARALKRKDAPPKLKSAAKKGGPKTKSAPGTPITVASSNDNDDNAPSTNKRVKKEPVSASQLEAAAVTADDDNNDDDNDDGDADVADLTKRRR
jgi:hypothetical protein